MYRFTDMPSLTPSIRKCTVIIIDHGLGVIKYTLNKKLAKLGHVGIKGGSPLVNHLVD